MCWGCGLDITKESYGHFSKCSLSDMHEEIIDAGNIYNDGGVNYVIRPFARAHQKNPVILFLLALLSWRLKCHNFSDQNFFGLSVVGIWLPVHHPLKPWGQFQPILAQNTGLSFSLNKGPSCLQFEKIGRKGKKVVVCSDIQRNKYPGKKDLCLFK